MDLLNGALRIAKCGNTLQRPRRSGAWKSRACRRASFLGWSRHIQRRGGSFKTASSPWQTARLRCYGHTGFLTRCRRDLPPDFSASPPTIDTSFCSYRGPSRYTMAVATIPSICKKRNWTCRRCLDIAPWIQAQRAYLTTTTSDSTASQRTRSIYLVGRPHLLADARSQYGKQAAVGGTRISTLGSHGSGMPWRYKSQETPSARAAWYWKSILSLDWRLARR